MRPYALIALLLAVAILCSQPAPREQVGPLPGGGFLLNSGWRLSPAGKQIPLDTFPMSTALSPDGRYLLVLNGGYNPPSISVLEASTGRETGRVRVADGWLGLTFSPKGDRVYVGGGSRAAVYEFSFANGALEPARTFTVVPIEKRSHVDFIGDVALTPDGHLLYAADLYHDSVVVINTQSGMLIDRVKTGRRPYRILFHPDGKSFFVTSWTDGAVGHYDTASGNQLADVRLGPHPTDMVWLAGKGEAGEGELPYAARLFIAASNTNSVYTLGVSEGKDLRLLETINTAMTPRQPAGMTPSGLALSPDGTHLYVVCSDGNVVAVVDVSPGERSHVAGFIPTGWYPTAARVLPGGVLVVLNGRGGGSHPNPNGPNPSRRPEASHTGSAAVEYVGRIQTGTASFIAPFTGEQLQAYTKTAVDNSAYRDEKLEAPNPFPPIQHIIYIVKENRSYDQVLGDIKEGNGDASLVLFGERITPNQHKLARQFVLLDNFYVNSDVSADGHCWSTAAIATDYIQKMWPNSYASRRNTYDYEEQEPTDAPPAGYLWSSAGGAGISMRNYGYMTQNRAKAAEDGTQIELVRDPVLNHVTNRLYRNFDLDYPDVERVKVFLNDLTDFEKSGAMPRLIFMRLGNDHTHGTQGGKLTPFSMVADNDYALGTLVEAVSKSRFWSSTAIFVLEDDAQNGPDHVDSHRSPAYLISPYVKHGAVDSSMYNTASMLRTMEMILGLNPMTQFDAAARPMSAAFQAAADPAPYAVEKPRVPLDERNPPRSGTAERSSRLDFSQEDRADADELNDILWTAIKGVHAPPPATSFFSR
ncbi:MAG TPA: bifunctional YncE family protein/alkaline phosphatase family protein [Bryobacteraceae bacterium]|nr:bifunctional YncE family protein/alkaline phosphatase family protein [Bryobacteraceae bacterium]